jgi:hypothetical protein
MPSLTEDLRSSLAEVPPAWEEVDAAYKLIGALGEAHLFALMFYLPLLEEDHPRIRMARQICARWERSKNLRQPGPDDRSRERLVERIMKLDPEEFLAGLWDRSGPTYRLLASEFGTLPNPSAARHPEEAEAHAAVFARAEVLDEKVAEMGRESAQKLKPVLEYFRLQ